MKSNRTFKSAFTLVELLVVIGIIGVLSAVMLGMLGGSGDAARATQCMTNLRGLSVAVLNYAMQDGDGNFPPAGSFKYTGSEEGRLTYPTRRGWVSWATGDGGNKSKSCPAYVTFGERDDKLLRYAITNGCIWAMGGKTEKIYQCPVHDAAFQKANKGRHPGWSYVMNEAFEWQTESKPKRRWAGQSHSGLRPYDLDKKGAVSRPPEKVLLFAEIQGLTDTKRRLTANTNGSGTKGDGVLQYRSTKESIGFNHVLSGGKLSGHVAFADGHVEKLTYPQNGDIQRLTEWLCSGHEISFNGSTYQDLQR